MPSSVTGIRAGEKESRAFERDADGAASESASQGRTLRAAGAAFCEAGAPPGYSISTTRTIATLAPVVARMRYKPGFMDSAGRSTR